MLFAPPIGGAYPFEPVDEYNPLPPPADGTGIPDRPTLPFNPLSRSGCSKPPGPTGGDWPVASARFDAEPSFFLCFDLKMAIAGEVVEIVEGEEGGSRRRWEVGESRWVVRVEWPALLVVS